MELLPLLFLLYFYSKGSWNCIDKMAIEKGKGTAAVVIHVAWSMTVEKSSLEEASGGRLIQPSAERKAID